MGLIGFAWWTLAVVGYADLLMLMWCLVAINADEDDADGVGAAQPAVPDGVWEALQRLIENGLMAGPASADDALLVAKWRGMFGCPYIAHGVDVPHEPEA